MTAPQVLTGVLSQYPPDCTPNRIESLGGAGGFSGARFWRLHTPRGILCLRRWPREHPSPARLRFIHTILRHVALHGFPRVPLPVATTAGGSFVHGQDHLWELAPWLEGAADFRTAPSPEKVAAALVALAEFHRAAATFALPLPQSTPPPGILQRSRRLTKLVQHEAATIQAAVAPDACPNLVELAGRLLAVFPQAACRLGDGLRAAATLKVAVQPCLRDVWDAHVLFRGNRVTGFIDFGAVDIDTVAADVARLLGSMAVDEDEVWRIGLESYAAVRPITPEERHLVALYDQSGLLLAGINWLDWIYVQRRQFEDVSAIEQRLRAILARLQRWVQQPPGQSHPCQQC